MRGLHGGDSYAHPECIDFSANLNPLGMPDAVRQAVIRNAGLWEHYPDPECLVLRQQLAKHTGVPSDQIVCGNGADDLIWRIIQTFSPGTALLPEPTFTEYRRALTKARCAVETFPLPGKNGFVLHEDFLLHLRPELDMVVLCNPNNPTGRLIPTELMREIARTCERYEIYLLVDECFLELVQEGERFSAQQFLTPHMIVLSAFTKTYAIPGLRLGYAIFGETWMADTVTAAGQYWSVSAPAQIAGMAALEETAYLEQSRRMIAEERQFLTEALPEMVKRVFPSEANFILFTARPGLFRAMLEEHILLRSCANFRGLNETFYRIAVRPHDENLALLTALRRCI